MNSITLVAREDWLEHLGQSSISSTSVFIDFSDFAAIEFESDEVARTASIGWAGPSELRGRFLLVRRADVGAYSGACTFPVRDLVRISAPDEATLDEVKAIICSR